MSNNNLVPILSAIIGVMIVLLILSFFKSGEKKGLANKSHRVRKPPLEFSKKILIATAGVTLFVILCAVTMSYQTQSTDVYNYLIPSIFSSLGIGLSFYFNKAKAENLIKIRNEQGEDVAELARKAMTNENEY